MTHGNQGFTIAEALVAIAILSLTLVSLYPAAGISLRGVGRAEASSRVVLLAQSKLDEIAATRSTFPETSEGAVPGTQVHWRIEAKDVPVGAATELHLQHIHLELTWDEDGAAKAIALDTRHFGWVRE